jgi:hypothetical protein
LIIRDITPDNAQHKNNVQRSLFSIQAINENSAFWANPREVDIIDDAIDHIWFQYKPFLPSEPYPIYPCELPTYPPYDPGPLDNMDVTIINGTFQPWRGYVAEHLGNLLLPVQTRDGKSRSDYCR